MPASPHDPQTAPFSPLAVAFVSLLARAPLRMLVAGLLVAVFALAGLARLQADFSHAGYFHPTDPWLQDFDRFEQTFGNDDAVIIAVKNPDGLFNPVSVTLLHALTDRMWQLPDVIRVDSLTNYQHVHPEGDDITVADLIPRDADLSPEALGQLRQIALNHETLPGYLVSPDGTMTLLFATLRPAGALAPDSAAVVAAARDLVAASETEGHSFHILGAPAIVASFADIAAQDNARIIPLLLIACILVLYLVLRSLWCVAYAMAVIVLSAVGVLGLAGWLGVQMTSITTVLPQILIGVAVADCLHVLTTYRLAQRDIADRREAAIYALTKNVGPTLLTTLTTAVGFISFSLSEIKTLADMGLVASVGVFLAWALTYLLLAPLLLLLPFGGRAAGSALRLSARGGASLVAMLCRLRTPVLAGFAGFILLGVLAATQVRVDADPVAYFAKGHPLRSGVEAVDVGIGSARNIEIVIDAGCPDCAKAPDFLNRVDALEHWIESHEDVVQVISILDVLKASRRALHAGAQAEYRVADTQGEIAEELLFYSLGLPQGLSLDNRISMASDAVRLTVMWRISSSAAALQTIGRIEAEAARLGLDATVTGKYSLYQRQESYVVGSFLTSVGIALLAISAILWVAFRSVRLGGIALLCNLPPLLMGGVGLWLLGETLNVGTVLVVSITLGIAVDDTVHILTDYRRQRRGGASAAQAFEAVFAETGVALFATTLVLVCAFGMSIFASFAPYQTFGILAAMVLVTALLVDLVVLPALFLGGKGGAQPAPDPHMPGSPPQPLNTAAALPGE